MELVNLQYCYINKFMNSDELLYELKNIDKSKYSIEELNEINNLIDNIEYTKRKVPNELDESEKKRLMKIEQMIEFFKEAKNNDISDEGKAFAEKRLIGLMEDMQQVHDGGKLFENIFQLMIKNDLIVSYAEKMSDEELLDFITKYIFAPVPPKLDQQQFNGLVKIGIQNDKREALWRLAFNYAPKNMKFNLIEDYFIEVKDAYYLIELICAVKEVLDIDEILKKVIATKDKLFMNDCANRALKLELITDEDIKKIVVSKYTYTEFKENFERIINNGGNPEYSFLLNEKKYIIKSSKDSVVFQKFENNESIEEVHFKNLDDLYNTKTIDDILLKRDWDKIENTYNN